MSAQLETVSVDSLCGIGKAGRIMSSSKPAQRVIVSTLQPGLNPDFSLVCPV